MSTVLKLTMGHIVSVNQNFQSDVWHVFTCCLRLWWDTWCHT